MALLKEVPDGAELVEITEIIHASAFWVIASGSMSETSSEEWSKPRAQLEMLEMFLASAKLTTIVAVNHPQTGKWHRGCVQAVKDANKCLYYVFLIDHGHTVEVSASALRDIDEYYKKQEPLANQILLFGIVPGKRTLRQPHGERLIEAVDWSAEAIAFVKNQIAKSSMGYFCQKGKHNNPNTLFGDLYLVADGGFLDLGLLLCLQKFAISSLHLFLGKYARDLKAVSKNKFMSSSTTPVVPSRTSQSSYQYTEDNVLDEPVKPEKHKRQDNQNELVLKQSDSMQGSMRRELNTVERYPNKVSNVNESLQESVNFSEMNFKTKSSAKFQFSDEHREVINSESVLENISYTGAQNRDKRQSFPLRKNFDTKYQNKFVRPDIQNTFSDSLKWTDDEGNATCTTLNSEKVQRETIPTKKSESSDINVCDTHIRTSERSVKFLGRDIERKPDLSRNLRKELSPKKTEKAAIDEGTVPTSVGQAHKREILSSKHNVIWDMTASDEGSVFEKFTNRGARKSLSPQRMDLKRIESTDTDARQNTSKGHWKKETRVCEASGSTAPYKGSIKFTNRSSVKSVSPQRIHEDNTTDTDARYYTSGEHWKKENRVCEVGNTVASEEDSISVKFTNRGERKSVSPLQKNDLNRFQSTNIDTRRDTFVGLQKRDNRRVEARGYAASHKGSIKFSNRSVRRSVSPQRMHPDTIQSTDTDARLDTPVRLQERDNRICEASVSNAPHKSLSPDKGSIKFTNKSARKSWSPQRTHLDRSESTDTDVRGDTSEEYWKRESRVCETSSSVAPRKGCIKFTSRNAIKSVSPPKMHLSRIEFADTDASQDTSQGLWDRENRVNEGGRTVAPPKGSVKFMDRDARQSVSSQRTDLDGIESRETDARLNMSERFGERDNRVCEVGNTAASHKGSIKFMGKDTRKSESPVKNFRQRMDPNTFESAGTDAKLNKCEGLWGRGNRLYDFRNVYDSPKETTNDATCISETQLTTREKAMPVLQSHGHNTTREQRNTSGSHSGNSFGSAEMFDNNSEQLGDQKTFKGSYEENTSNCVSQIDLPSSRKSKKPNLIHTFFPAGFNMAEADKVVSEKIVPKSSVKSTKASYGKSTGPFSAAKAENNYSMFKSKDRLLADTTFSIFNEPKLRDSENQTSQMACEDNCTIVEMPEEYEGKKQWDIYEKGHKSMFKREETESMFFSTPSETSHKDHVALKKSEVPGIAPFCDSFKACRKEETLIKSCLNGRQKQSVYHTETKTVQHDVTLNLQKSNLHDRLSSKFTVKEEVADSKTQMKAMCSETGTNESRYKKDSSQKIEVRKGLIPSSPEKQLFTTIKETEHKHMSDREEETEFMLCSSTSEIPHTNQVDLKKADDPAVAPLCNSFKAGKYVEIKSCMNEEQKQSVQYTETQTIQTDVTPNLKISNSHNNMFSKLLVEEVAECRQVKFGYDKTESCESEYKKDLSPQMSDRKSSSPLSPEQQLFAAVNAVKECIAVTGISDINQSDCVTLLDQLLLKLKNVSRTESTENREVKASHLRNTNAVDISTVKHLKVKVLDAILSATSEDTHTDNSLGMAESSSNVCTKLIDSLPPDKNRAASHDLNDFTFHTPNERALHIPELAKPAQVEAAKPALIEPSKRATLVLEKPAPVELAKPGPIDLAKPAPFEPAKPAPFEPARPAPFEPARPAPFEPAKPAPFEPAKPAPFEPARPAPFEPAKPAPFESAKPAPFEPAKPAPVDLAKPTPIDQSVPDPAQPAPVELAKPELVDTVDPLPVDKALPALADSAEPELSELVPVDLTKPGPLDLAKPAPVDLAIPVPVDSDKPASVDLSIPDLADPAPGDLAKLALVNPSVPDPSELGLVDPAAPVLVDPAAPVPVDPAAPALVDSAKFAPVDLTKPAPVDLAQPTLADFSIPVPFDLAKFAPVDLGKPAPVYLSIADPTVPARVDSSLSDPAEPALVGVDEPAPVGLVEPAPVGLMEPAPVGLVEPAPVGLVEPAPVGLVEPAPVGLVEPAPVGLVEPAPVGLVEPAPVDLVEPAPVDLVEPAPVDLVEPAPVDLVEPAPVDLSLHDPTEPAPVDLVEPAPIDLAKPDSVKPAAVASAEPPQVALAEIAPVDPAELAPVETTEHTTVKSAKAEYPGSVKYISIKSAKQVELVNFTHEHVKHASIKTVKVAPTELTKSLPTKHSQLPQCELDQSQFDELAGPPLVKLIKSAPADSAVFSPRELAGSSPCNHETPLMNLIKNAHNDLVNSSKSVPEPQDHLAFQQPGFVECSKAKNLMKSSTPVKDQATSSTTTERADKKSLTSTPQQRNMSVEPDPCPSYVRSPGRKIMDQLQLSVVLLHGAPKDFRYLNLVTDAILRRDVHEVLKTMLYRLMRIQKYAWPLIQQGHSCVLVGPPMSGKTLGYAVPLLDQVMQKVQANEIPKGNGPVMLVLCSGSKCCNEIFEICYQFVRKCVKEIKMLVAYGGGAEKIEFSLINGCHILITTPRCFKRLLQLGSVVVNFARLRYLVLDQADVLTLRFLPEVDFISKRVERDMKPQERKLLQVVAVAEKWCPGLEFIVKGLPSPVVCIGAFLEAIVYAHLKPQVHFVTQCNRISIVQEVIKGAAKDHRTLIVCKEVEEVVALYEALRTTVDPKHLIMAHHNLDSIDINELYVKWSCMMQPVLVCSDVIVQEMSIQGATQLIHFSLTSVSKREFAYRCSTLIDRLPSMFECEEDKGSKMQSQMHIFIADNDSEPLPTLVRFLKRVGVTVDPDLQKRANIAEVQKDLKKDWVPLCTNTKAFGDCWNKSNCPFRHVISSADKPRNIPTSGNVKVTVLHVHDACNYSARVYEHTNANGQVEVVPNLVTSITRKMHSYFKDDAHRQVDFLFAERVRGVYHRVEVLAIFKTDRHDNPTEILVRYIDDGCRELIKAERLFELPPELIEIPPQCVDIFVCRLAPCDLDWSWGPVTIDKVAEILRETVQKDRFLIGKIKLSLRHTLWLDPLECYEHLVTLKTNTIIFSLRRKLLEAQLAVESPQHLELLSQACVRAGIEVPQYAPSNTSLHIEKSEKFDVCWAHLPADEFTLVYFVVGDHPGRFYVRQEKFEDLVHKMDKKLTKLAKERDSNSRTLFAGDYCIGRFPEDKRWYRAHVENSQNDTLDLFFVDHGDRATVSRSEAVPLPKDLITQLPFQVLDKIKPADCTGGYKYHVALIEVTPHGQALLNNSLVAWGLASQSEEQKLLLQGLDFSHLTSPLERNCSSESEDDEMEEDEEKSFKSLNETEVIFEDTFDCEQSECSNIQCSEVNSSSLAYSLESTASSTEARLENTFASFDFSAITEDEIKEFFVKSMEDYNTTSKAATSNAPSTMVVKDQEKLEEDSSSRNCATLDESKKEEDSTCNQENPMTSSQKCNPSCSLSVENEECDSNSALEDDCIMPHLVRITRTPLVYWRQDAYFVWLMVDLPGVDNYYLRWDEDNVHFWTVVKDNVYSFDLHLFGPIVPTSLTHSGGLFVRIKMQKVLIALFHILCLGMDWLRLVVSSEKLLWVKRHYDAENSSDMEELRLTEQLRIIKEMEKKKEDRIEKGGLLPADETTYEADDSDSDSSSSDLFLADEQYDPYDPLN
ncbi:Putative ATP-dependent RNA helicase TDRD12 [Gryllus bimaculatus]|nr:Putative ATP-dependent RNA helicase TDRD12 [Gryllus bimaculatus]